jgi:hypothetical protein
MTIAPDDLTRRLCAWTYHRQRLGRAAASPIEALGDVVGVYSSHPTAPLALLARSQALTPASLGELEESRAALRLPGMRGSVFLLPATTAPRVYATVRDLVQKDYARRLAVAGLTWDEYTLVKEQVLALARTPQTPKALQAALPIEGRLMTAVRLMALEGVVLRLGTSLRTDNLTYVATEAWLGHPLPAADPEASPRWLAEAYLRGYGPARVADFAWWSGLTKGRAQVALAAVPTVDVGGGLLLPADQEAGFASVEPLPAAALDVLPKWDAYTMGLAPAGRQRFIADEYLPRVYGGGGGLLPGDGRPLLLRGGRAVATWSHRFAGARLQVQVTPFAPDALPAALYAHAFDAAGELLGARTVEVVTTPAGAVASRAAAE